MSRRDTVPGIDLGTVTVVGDNSYGVHLLSGVTLEGPLTIDGAVSRHVVHHHGRHRTGVTGVEIDGNIVGNITVGKPILGGSIVATAAAALGVTRACRAGHDRRRRSSTTAPSKRSVRRPRTPHATSTTGNPKGGSPSILANSVTGGIYNAGPIASGDVGVISAALIVSQGAGPAVLISPTKAFTTAPLNIGLYTKADGSAPADPGYDFYNRGQISAQPRQCRIPARWPCISWARLGTPVVFQGGTIGSMNYLGGILNSGLIASSASTDTNASGVTASTALWIDNYVTVPVLNNSSEVGAGHGNITATRQRRVVGAGHRAPHQLRQRPDIAIP